MERTLENLRGDRERLGAVNLRADDELSESTKKQAELVAERDDLTEAIRKLRLAITASTGKDANGSSPLSMS